MSTDRDVTRIVRSWMDEGVTQLPDRVLDLVLDQLPATPQRRPSWLARRTPTMNNYARLGLVAAAVLAVVIVGIGLFGRPTNVGPAPSPTPSFAASPPAAVNPLVGTWVAPEVTCAQQVAVIEAAGYTAEQITQARAQMVQELAGFIGNTVGPPAFMDPTCENIGYEVRNTDQWSVVFDGLPVAATIRSARTYDYDLVPSGLNYRLVGDSTFELGEHNGKAWVSCLTLRYSIVGDQLTIERIAPSCAGGADEGLVDQIALTAILETSSFTRQP